MYFASARDLVGGIKEESVPLPTASPTDGMVVKDFVEFNLQRHPNLRKLAETMMVALNQEYVEKDAEDEVVRPGDEFAFIPPVSGGGSKDDEKRKGLELEQSQRIVYEARSMACFWRIQQPRELSVSC